MHINVSVMLAEGEELALEPARAAKAVLRALKGTVGNDMLYLSVSTIPKSVQVGQPAPTPPAMEAKE